jgi:Flp pilus assembly protein TadG
MSGRRCLRSRTAKRGQALAEFALVLPMILLFIAAILEFGRAWNIKQAVTDAAREGARYTVVMDTEMTLAEVEDKIKERLALASIDTSVVEITSSDPACSPITNCFHTEDGYGREMTVKVSTLHRMGLVKVLLGWAGVSPNITIATDATMRHE